MLRRSPPIPDEVAPPSPEAIAAEIAAGVHRTAEHEKLAAQIARIEAERETALVEMRRLIAEFAKETNDAVIRKLQKKSDALHEKIQELRRQVRPLRFEHAERVKRAMAASRAEAECVMLRGLQALNAGAALEAARRRCRFFVRLLD